MKLIKASYKILTPINGEEILKKIERAGRTCYKSEDKITDKTAGKFVSMLIRSGHESVIEHENISILFVCDRGISHELVRHRLASFSQESTRYCNYSKEKFGNEITCIAPFWFSEKDIDSINSGDFSKCDEDVKQWAECMKRCEDTYNFLAQEIPNKWQAQQARSVLPNSLKTELVVTANMREWRTILKQRASKGAHPQMWEIMLPLLEELKTLIPVIFDDI